MKLALSRKQKGLKGKGGERTAERWRGGEEGRRGQAEASCTCRYFSRFPIKNFPYCKLGLALGKVSDALICILRFSVCIRLK